MTKPAHPENEWTAVRVSRETCDIINTLAGDLGHGSKMTNGTLVKRMADLFAAAVAHGLLDTEEGFLFFYGKEGYAQTIAPFLVEAIRDGIPQSDGGLLPGTAVLKLQENKKTGKIQHLAPGSI